MSGEIASVAQKWLFEPRYVTAFKLSYDVFKDQSCNEDSSKILGVAADTGSMIL